MVAEDPAWSSYSGFLGPWQGPLLHSARGCLSQAVSTARTATSQTGQVRIHSTYCSAYRALAQRVGVCTCCIARRRGSVFLSASERSERVSSLPAALHKV